jgi:hypothetical protein
MNESEFDDANFVPPLATFYTVESGYNFTFPGCEYICWPTVVTLNGQSQNYIYYFCKSLNVTLFTNYIIGILDAEDAKLVEQDLNRLKKIMEEQ